MRHALMLLALLTVAVVACATASAPTPDLEATAEVYLERLLSESQPVTSAPTSGPTALAASIGSYRNTVSTGQTGPTLQAASFTARAVEIPQFQAESTDGLLAIERRLDEIEDRIRDVEDSVALIEARESTSATPNQDAFEHRIDLLVTQLVSRIDDLEQQLGSQALAASLVSRIDDLEQKFESQTAATSVESRIDLLERKVGIDNRKTLYGTTVWEDLEESLERDPFYSGDPSGLMRRVWVLETQICPARLVGPTLAVSCP